MSPSFSPMHPVLRADDAHRHRLPEAQRVADRQHVVADAHAIRVAQRARSADRRAACRCARPRRRSADRCPARAPRSVGCRRAGRSPRPRPRRRGCSSARCRDLSTMNPEPSASCFSRVRARRRHPELLAQHPVPWILDREAADELRALDGDDRALDAVDERRDRARLGARCRRRPAAARRWHAAAAANDATRDKRRYRASDHKASGRP